MSTGDKFSERLCSALLRELERFPDVDGSEVNDESNREITPNFTILTSLRCDPQEILPKETALRLSELTPPHDFMPDWRTISEIPPVAFMETLVVLNAAMMPGWPFPSALVSVAPVVALPIKAAKADMSDEERAAYLAKLVAPYQTALTRLRNVLRDLEQHDPEEAERLFYALLKALITVAEAVRTALNLTEAGRLAAEELALASPSPEGPSSRRHRYRL